MRVTKKEYFKTILFTFCLLFYLILDFNIVRTQMYYIGIFIFIGLLYVVLVDSLYLIFCKFKKIMFIKLERVIGLVLLVSLFCISLNDMYFKTEPWSGLVGISLLFFVCIPIFVVMIILEFIEKRVKKYG